MRPCSKSMFGSSFKRHPNVEDRRRAFCGLGRRTDAFFELQVMNLCGYGLEPDCSMRGMLAACACLYPDDPVDRAAALGAGLVGADLAGAGRLDREPSFFLSAPEMAPRMVCCCQPVASAICSTVAPSGRLSSSIIWACLVPARGVGLSAGAALAGLAASPWPPSPWPCAWPAWPPARPVRARRAPAAPGLRRRPSCAVRGALWRVRGRDRRAALVVQLDPEVGRAQAAVEQARRGGEDVVGGEAEPLGAAADRAQGLAPVGGAARRVVERRQDGRELLLAEVGGGHGMISIAGEHDRPPTSPSPGGWSRAGRGREIGPATRRARPR